MKFINALVVKLVDTKDLKSLQFMECQFESFRVIIKINIQKKINEFKDDFFILIFTIKFI